MSQVDQRDAKQSGGDVERRPTDVLWFTVLFASIAVGIGMTIFAPVGNPPIPAQPATIPAPPSVAPATTSTATTTPATAPSTSPAP